MSARPIFVPVAPAQGLVREIPFSSVWHPGFAAVQKEKNIHALHEAAREGGVSPVLEVSTKSERKLGRHLSAFHLTVPTHRSGIVRLECAFQGSKVFERGGPYADLYDTEPRNAKRDPRLRDSGRLTGFWFEGMRFPAEPRTAFYDWLYISALCPHRQWLARLQRYAGFSDIEFNPSARSIVRLGRAPSSSP